MLPNSRKIPAVPSATHYQTDPTPVSEEDAQHSTTSPPPVISSGKTGGFFSRFARRRSQSTAAVTPKHLPKPSESFSTKTAKPTPPLPHQLHATVPASRSTIPKVQRKPIASEPVSSKNLFLLYNEKNDGNAASTPIASSYSASTKPVVKKKGSASLDPLRKISQKLEKAKLSTPLSPKASTFAASTTEKKSTVTPPPAPASTFSSRNPKPPATNGNGARNDPKPSNPASRQDMFQIAEKPAQHNTKRSSGNGEKARSSNSTNESPDNNTKQPSADQPDLRALGVREKDLKAIQESLDRLSSGSAAAGKTSSVPNTIDHRNTVGSPVNGKKVYENKAEPSEPPTLADIVLQNTKSRKNARVIPDTETSTTRQREDIMLDGAHNALSSESFHTMNGGDSMVDNDSSFAEITGDSMMESDSDDDSDEADNGEESFVDATGVSQEDIERERAERRLTKRLSGGHFGSAGGLLLSIAGQAAEGQHRNSNTPSFGSVEKALLEFDRRGSLSLLADFYATGDSEKPDTAQRNKAVPPVPPVKDQASSESTKEPAIVIEEIPTPRTDTSDTISLETSADEALKKEAETAAKKLWAEDPDFIEKDVMTEWMGQPKPLNSLALTYYMNMFDFSLLRLDSAFRRLCNKLYVKAESQQIDRILEVFARRYWQCNKKSVFGSADVVYAVTYSMLLLNTDLHVVQGSHTRMTRSAFVRNTMSAAYAQGPGNDRNQDSQASKFPKWWEAEMEIYLRELYYSIKQRQILQPREHQLENHRPKSFLDASGVNGLKKSVGNMVRSTRESMILTTDMGQPNPRPSLSNLQRPISPPNMRRKISVTSMSSTGSHSSNPRSPGLSHQQPAMSFPNSSASFTSQPPFYKEGIVMRKHLLESGDQKAKNRDWKECMIVVTRGELQVFSVSPNGGEVNHRRSMLRASSASLVNLADSFKTGGGSNSFSGATLQPQTLSTSPQLIESVSLNHSLSNALPPPGYNRHRPYVFALQLPNGGVYLFQVAVQEQVNEWVSTCNYWAARGSKEPLSGGVSNMEYGWGMCLADVILDLDAVENGDDNVGNSYLNPDQVVLYEWRPPAPPLVSSTLSDTEQLSSLQKQLATLTADINAHRELKKKIEVKFPVRSTNNVRALTNWENRSRYLLHEIIKLQNYCDILEKAIAKSEKESAKATTPSP
ncbi:hypothetical protein BC943DRAFT_326198 [Umbelopsis sp. AD052]|nr:hypothetical protein BC943DRAFT_326198 [Umbelopsis sp. AD052]